MEGLLKTVDTSINASKAKAMPALIPDEEHQVVLLDDESNGCEAWSLRSVIKLCKQSLMVGAFCT